MSLTITATWHLFFSLSFKTTPHPPKCFHIFSISIFEKSTQQQQHQQHLSLSLSLMDTTKDEFQVVDHLTTPTTTTGTSFSQLLLADDDVVVVDNQNQNQNHNPLVGLLHGDQTFSNTSLFSLHNTPKMLCFGGNYQNEIEIVTPPQKSVVTSSDSSSASSCNHTNTAFNNVSVCLFKNDVVFIVFYFFIFLFLSL